MIYDSTIDYAGHQFCLDVPYEAITLSPSPAECCPSPGLCTCLRLAKSDLFARSYFRFGIPYRDALQQSSLLQP